MKNLNQFGFTLIELLIVVAIIGILAAIAVPNFLNARTRANVARTNGDLRALAMAIQTYRVDQNAYPPNRSHLTMHLHALTTPVSYISTVGFQDIFKARQGDTGNSIQSYLYFLYKSDPVTPNMAWIDSAGVSQWSTDGFCLASWGPDRVQGARANNDPTGASLGPPIEWVYIRVREGHPNTYGGVYAPSNGTVSAGDIGRWGGNVPGVPQILGG
jgi:prepilin-type N-terminal cleavage/methylation domain-containing protein